MSLLQCTAAKRKMLNRPESADTKSPFGRLVTRADGHAAGVARLESLVAGLPNVLFVNQQAVPAGSVRPAQSLRRVRLSAPGRGVRAVPGGSDVPGQAGGRHRLVGQPGLHDAGEFVPGFVPAGAAEARRRPVRARAVLGGAGPGGGGRVHAASWPGTPGGAERVAALGQQTVRGQFWPEGAGRLGGQRLEAIGFLPKGRPTVLGAAA